MTNNSPTSPGRAIFNSLADFFYQQLAEDFSQSEAESFSNRLKIAKSVCLNLDTSQVWINLVVWIFLDSDWGIMNYVEVQNQPIIQRLINLYQQSFNGQEVSERDWNLIAQEARSRSNQILHNYHNYAQSKVLFCSYLCAEVMRTKPENHDNFSKKHRLIVYVAIDATVEALGIQAGREMLLAIKNYFFDCLWNQGI
ncbi:MAG: hypothetical protein HC820_00850 [Hydrococcus sp. RM1_1_31]|nr:hypothetical protein [Hydrococcus sp. RM1_1_31]